MVPLGICEADQLGVFGLLFFLVNQILCGHTAETKLHPLLQNNNSGHKHSRRNNIQNSLMNIVKPEQIHISFGEKMNDIVVVWASRRRMDEPYVEYGHDTNLIKASAETTEFTEANKDGAKFWHRAYLSDLEDGEKYFYRINSARGAGIASDQLAFTVPSLKKNLVHSVMIIADMGISSKTIDFLVQEALNGGYEAVIHIGDISNDLHRGEGVIGDRYLRRIQKMAAQVPYMTCPGDQEKFKEYIHYRYRFSMPGSPWPMSAQKLWYSYELGNAHFIVINTEILSSDHELKKSHISWLINDLTVINRAERPKHPWVIMFGHKPMYSSCDKTEPECSVQQPALRKELEDIMFKFGVDVYIAGHQHNYERSWPVYREKNFNMFNYKNPKAPIHLTIGSMGAEYHADKFKTPGGLWSAFRYPGAERELFAKLDIINASHLFWEVLASNNNEKVDRIWIIQNSHGTFGKPGEDAHKRAMELKNIPMQPPLPPEYHEKNQAESIAPKLARYKFVPRKKVIPGMTGNSLVIITLAVIFVLCLASGRFRKRLWTLCRRSTGVS